MWTRTLTLLSLILLAAQGLLTEAQSGEQDDVNLEAEQDGWVPLEKPVIVSTSPPTQVIVTGSFVSRDQAKCNVTVTRQEEGVHLQAHCVRLHHEFSCVFAGNPTACLHCLNNDKVYWRQIGWRLRHLNRICEDSKAILNTRVCGTKYPESSLTLVSSTLASRTSVQGLKPTPTVSVKEKKPSQAEPSKDTH